MPTEAEGFPPETADLFPDLPQPESPRVQTFRKRPVEVSMVRWDGSSAAFREIDAAGGKPQRVTEPYRDGRLGIWVAKSAAVCHVADGDWVALEPDGTGVYPLTEADREAGYEPVTEPSSADDEPSLPEGIYGRVEFPGMRGDTGWITEGTRGGQCVLVVRDWDGCPLGEYILGPACRLVHLPTPLRRPEKQERAAITGSADPWGHYADDEEDVDDDDDLDEGDDDDDRPF
jgi:hypothetical protein